MRKLLGRPLIGLLLTLLCVSSYAQSVRITGTVTSQTGNQPLNGVTVTNAATNEKTVTDASGRFVINAQKGQKIYFTSVTFERREVTVGDNTTITVRLADLESTLETVVVAMDQKRKPKELGYSTQGVSGAEVQETQRENFINALQGRVAGLTVNPTSGLAGSSSQIVLRGFNSLSLDNSPLFVIDGIIVDNQTINESGGAGTIGLARDQPNRQADYSNRIADINPNDIASITVLKGPEATALYGSQASSGAIVITTKKAPLNSKVRINYDNSFRTQHLTRFPKTISTYQAGTNGIAIPLLNSASGTYFGPVADVNRVEFDNVENFFRTGFAQTHNLSADYGLKNASFRVSGSYFDQESPVPTNTFRRVNLKLSNTTKIGKYIELIPSISYINTKNDRPIRGAGGFMLTLLTWPRTNDIRNWEDPAGDKLPLFAANPNAEIDNSLFNVNRNRTSDENKRWIGTMGININPFSWLSLAGRFGYDTYSIDGYTTYHPLSWYVTRASGGLLDNYYRRYYGYNHTITATIKKEVKDFSFRVLLGNTWQDYETQMYSTSGNNLIDSVSAVGDMWKNGRIITQREYVQLTAGFDSSLTRPSSRIRLNNAARGLPNYSISRQVAYFGEATLGWKKGIYLTYSHRFEESSIFPPDFRNYNYPAASASFVLTDLLPDMRGRILEFWKLRGSVANTARSSSPYANQSVFNQHNGIGGGFAYGFGNNNPLLQPERQQTFELGTEFKFFKNRLAIDATYYNTKNDNLIVENFRASYGTGFVLNTLNVGSNQNQGVEIVVDVTPIETKNLRWSSRFNFNRMWNEVTSLPANVPEFYISDTWLYSNARGGLIVGGPTTTITAFGYARNNTGQILVSPTTGLPVIDANFRVRGDRNPLFSLGWLNNFSYKRLRVSMLWDLKVGGDIFNATEMYLTLQGLSPRTGDRTSPRVVQGVLQDGLENTATPTRNTISITPYNNQAYYTTMPPEEFIEKDVNWFRMRDLTISYTFDSKRLFLRNALKGLSAFVTANDLVLLTNYSGADPAANGNTAGSRGVGAFGFDYGNIPTPVSFNFGIRANF
jgi:TonB-linked SusC/RagA family outer membrane protein